MPLPPHPPFRLPGRAVPGCFRRQKGRVDIAKTLIDNGADPKIENDVSFLCHPDAKSWSEPDVHHPVLGESHDYRNYNL